MSFLSIYLCKLHNRFRKGNSHFKIRHKKETPELAKVHMAREIQSQTSAKYSEGYFLSISNYSLTIHPPNYITFFFKKLFHHLPDSMYFFWHINCQIYLPSRSHCSFPVVFKILFLTFSSLY